MADHKRTFILYKDMLPMVESLTDEQAGVLFLRILEYVNGIAVEIEDPDLVDVFDYAITGIEKSWGTYHDGKYHWNWKGGISPANKLLRNSEAMKYWRQSVFVRDDYTCTICKQRGGVLHAHHRLSFAKHPDQRFNVDNGQTLCKECHINLHRKEKKDE